MFGNNRRTHIDKTLALLIALLVLGGSLIFASAAFGLLARGTSGMTSVVFNHLVLGIGAGIVALLFTSAIDHTLWRRFAPYLFVAAILGTALVFVPHLGASMGGGRRWIVLFHVSFQPSEALKITGVIMAAAYFSSVKSRVNSLLYGLGGFLGIIAAPAVLLVLQPDIGTLGVVCASIFAVYIAAGARLRDICLIICIGILGLGGLVIAKPYIRDRVTTFLDPSQGQQTESYQIKQALIAVGSGEFLGRGFGQGVQKFTYLPEPMGDSIFAVAGEELGFVGATAIVIAFLAFALRGFAVATHAPDLFGSLLAVGITTYLASEAFINIAATLGVAPLTGIPLTFVSQGGSAMLASLASAGILLGVSRHRSAK